MKYEPGERFNYCNGGYMVLALIAERASASRSMTSSAAGCRPAGMTDTAFLRSDELPGRAAVGYLEARARGAPTSSTSRCGATATAGSTRPAADVSRSGGRCSPGGSSPRRRLRRWCAHAARCRTSRCATGSASGSTRRATLSMLDGCDAGVSFRSVHDPRTQVTLTVISNTAGGAWPILRYLEDAASN